MKLINNRLETHNSSVHFFKEFRRISNNSVIRIKKRKKSGQVLMYFVEKRHFKWKLSLKNLAALFDIRTFKGRSISVFCKINLAEPFYKELFFWRYHEFLQNFNLFYKLFQNFLPFKLKLFVSNNLSHWNFFSACKKWILRKIRTRKKHETCNTGSV